MPRPAPYLELMIRAVLVGALALLFAAQAAAVAGPPLWLRQAAETAARPLSDGTVPVSISYLAPRSRFPRVAPTGSFVCNDCSGPSGAAAPTGTVAELRFDDE